MLSHAQIGFGVRELDFSTVYRDRFTAVTTWLRALGVPMSELEDLAQEVFLVVQRKLTTFDGKNLDGWLYRIAQRTASDHRRRVWFRHWIARAPEETLSRVASDDATPQAAYERRESEAELEKLLASIDRDQRVVFWLFEIEERPTKEIAETLEVPETTVWMRLHRARQSLRKKIERAQKGTSR